MPFNKVHIFFAPSVDHPLAASQNHHQEPPSEKSADGIAAWVEVNFRQSDEQLRLLEVQARLLEEQDRVLSNISQRLGKLKRLHTQNDKPIHAALTCSICSAEKLLSGHRFCKACAFNTTECPLCSAYASDSVKEVHDDDCSSVEGGNFL